MRYLLLILVLGLASILRADDSPATQPAETRALLNGQIEYTSPAEWHFSEKNADEDTAVFVSEDRHGAMILKVQPADMSLSDQVAVAIVKRLREERKKSGAKVIKEAKIEKDSRFDIRIYEEYQQDNNTYAKLYLYRKRGKRPVAVTVTALNAEDDLKKSILQAGEETLISVKWVKKK